MRVHVPGCGQLMHVRNGGGDGPGTLPRRVLEGGQGAGEYLDVVSEGGEEGGVAGLDGDDRLVGALPAAPGHGETQGWKTPEYFSDLSPGARRFCRWLGRYFNRRTYL